MRYNLHMITLRISATGLTGLSQQMSRLSQGQLDKAIKNGVTRTARKYVEHKKARIEQDIDRPNAFTKRAYDYDKADASGRARVFVRDKQAQYLAPMEFGSTVTARGKKRPYSISPSVADKQGGLFGAKGLTRKFLVRSQRAQAKVTAQVAAGGKGYRNGAKQYFVEKLRGGGNVSGGLFVRTKTAGKWKTEMLAVMLNRATYRPALGFRRDAEIFARRNFTNFVNDEVTRVLSRRVP